MNNIEDVWDWLLSRPDLGTRMREMIRAASKRPTLRSLLPYLSMERTLKFSQTTEWPFSEGFPSIKCVGPDSYPVGFVGQDSHPAGFVISHSDMAPMQVADLSAALDTLERFLSGRP